jgi:hypothetical protein|eukprot:COSAG06_NODE_11880_length_1452_cov_47.591279_3_plen_78_part_00
MAAAGQPASHQANQLGLISKCTEQGCATLAEFELLCELAEQKGLQLMLAMATRANPAVIKVKEMIEVTKRTVLAIYA